MKSLPIITSLFCPVQVFKCTGMNKHVFRFVCSNRNRVLLVLTACFEHFCLNRLFFLNVIMTHCCLAFSILWSATTQCKSILLRFLERQVFANSADPDQTEPREAICSGLHCLRYCLYVLEVILYVRTSV